MKKKMQINCKKSWDQLHTIYRNRGGKKAKEENSYYLSHRSQNSSSNPFFFRSDGNLGRDTRLAGVGHLDQSRNFASRYCLAEKLEGMCAGADGDFATLKRLQRQSWDELFSSICHINQYSGTVPKDID